MKPVELVDNDDNRFGDMLQFIIQCLPAAVSVIKSERQYERVVGLKDLLLNNSGMRDINYCRNIFSYL